jgi:hypothetical protein
MISRAERMQYLEQERFIQRQREEEKRKWERELKEGGKMLRSEMSGRYLLINI